MANLYDQSMPNPNMSHLFGYRGGASSNPIGAFAQNDPLLAGTARTLASINQFRGVNDPNPQATVAKNVNAANATLYPTDRGAQAFREYVRAAYPDGKMPARIKELMNAATRGGINDMGLAVAMSSDEQRRKQAGTYDYGDRIGGLGGGSPLQAIQGDSYLEGVLNAPAELAKAQDLAALGPTGPGMFAPLLAAASFFTPLSPVAAGLFSAYRGGVEQDPFQAIGGIGTIGASMGAFDGLGGAIKDAFGGGGFTNPGALDFSGAGTGANALGLNAGQWSGLTDIAGGFVNPSAIATPFQINEAINYVPQAFGGPEPSSGIGDVLKAGKSLLPFLDEEQPPQASGGLLGGSSQGIRNPYNPLQAPPPPDPLRYFRLETRAR